MQDSDLKIIEEIEQLSNKELNQLIEDTNNEYNEWNINFPNLVDNLKDCNKIFLNDLIQSDEVGERIIYIIYGLLDEEIESLNDYDEISNGGLSDIISLLNEEGTLQFIDLIVDFKKQNIELTEDEIDFNKIIAKLKREVASLKKKLSQPSKYINTKQFEERYGLTRLQQKGLRSKIHDPLPHTITNGKTILYEPTEVEKWLENYKEKYLNQR